MEEIVEHFASSKQSSLKKEVGGEHYKMAIQPIEFITANKLPFIEGNVIKYVCRHRKKNGREDIEKAIHYLEMLLDLEYRDKRVMTDSK